MRLYRTGLDLFDDWYWRNGRDLAAAVYALRNLLDGVDGPLAWQLLRASVEPAPAPPG